MTSDPIACSLSGAELGTREREWRAVARAALVERTEIAGGIRLRFRGEGDVAERLRQLIAAERECCPFLDMSLTPGDGELVLDITAQQDAQPVLELMFSS